VIITQPKGVIAQFVEFMTHVPGAFNEPYNAIGFLKHGKLVAGVIFDNKGESNVCMHVAGVGKHWLTPEFLFACFDYPFNQLGLRRVTGLVPKKNKQARKFDEHLGFKLEGTMKHALKNDDLLVYGLLKENCRWIQDEFVARVLQRQERHAMRKAA
jgi:hypothetical protein